MKTIKQLADELGVSKTAIRKYMSDEVKTKFSETVSGVIYISLQGERLIKSAYYQKNQQKTENQVSTMVSGVVSSEVSSEVSALIEMLQRELEIKNKQIEDLTATIRLQSESMITDKKNELAETIINNSKLISDAKKPFWMFWKK